MDEDALVIALESGQVRSVGLDVYQQEPNIHPGLLVNPHVCLLPHMGTSTVEVGQLRHHLMARLSFCRPRRTWKSGPSLM
jgi:phosphoglycerate dehydrogenase-like enzyme